MAEIQHTIETVTKVYNEILKGCENDTNRVTIDEQQRKAHGLLLSYHSDKFMPDIVVYPRTAEEVAHVHKVCFAYSFPITPYGRGTSLEGHTSPLHGGVTLNLTKMNKILTFNQEDMDITVQTGVTREQLNLFLAKYKFFFPVDPGANCSIGGMVATRASGTTTIKYGTIRENVLRLKVVTSSGEIITTGSRAKKSSAGYDLTKLFIGSEGTLATVVEITLKVYTIPTAIVAAICYFTNMQDASTTVIKTIQAGVPIGRIELLDEMAMKAVNQNSGLTYKETPALFFEFTGNSQAYVKEQALQVQEICKQNGGSGFHYEVEAEKRNLLWRARHKAYYATLALRPGSKALTTDVCVPISKLAQCIVETKKDFDKTGLIYTLVSHSGDGNFHLIICLDDKNPKEMEAVHEAYDKLIKRALSFDGTCTGEHGVGLGKIGYLLFEHGTETLKVMKNIKKALDPKGIMNPLKVLPTDAQIEEFRQKYEVKKSKL